ncbi:IPT/TIG domain-containing protein [Nubsella zeaxanthinifaciens]|uniref:IPT/TIG domain-containing protein n=1 Tax=Nubsella zeaxanthinifaciens TaxID=392412 RepID=UPI000DE210E5|nr:IPT/TIG domain-containing protein [Nubsella zeaxanthinifaciens]
MKKLALFSAIYLVMALTFSSCKKEKFAPPEIQSLSIKVNSLSSITFIGNVLNTGNQNTKDYGFIYSTTNGLPSESVGTKVSMGGSPSKGQFSKTLTNLIVTNPSYSNTIWARAYITDENGTVFGAAISAQLPQPTTSGISSSSGKSGDIVKFYGKYHNPTANNVTVNFGNVKAKVISAADSEIAVEVPSGVNAGHGQNVPITISISGSAAVNSTYFTMLANVKDYTPKTGPVGTIVSLIGDNLPNGYYSSTPLSIYFGDVLTTAYYSSQVTVPFTVGARSQVYFAINGQKQALPGEFTVIAPQITSISPSSGIYPGQTLYIAGANFPSQSDASSGRPMVKLGNGDYQIVYLQSNNTYGLNTQSTLAEGEYTLYLRLGPHEVQAADKVKVLAYTATGFSPSSGGPGKEINISGNFIQGSGYTVSFGASSSYGNATSSTNLRVYVPSGINAGKVKLTVDFPNKKVVIPGDFEILGPVFSSFTPVSGVAGTLITIRGSNFFPGTYNTYVKFGTVNVSPISVTENTIVVAVPSNVNPGAMKLSVVTNGQTIMHSDNFTITN